MNSLVPFLFGSLDRAFTAAHKPSRPGIFSRQNNQAERNNNRARAGKEHERNAEQNDRAADEADDDSSQSLWQSIQANTFPNIPGPLHTSLYRTSAMLQLHREVREFLAEFRRNVGDDDRVIPFVFQFEHVANAMNFSDQC